MAATPPPPDGPAPSSEPDDVPYQSLYRRYRPQRFAEVRGQDQVTRPLRNAVRDSKVAHAYLFSGPRGTGKTSTARILAMALNCEHPVDGEPDGTCTSCVEIRRGASLDVHELDAASNRKLDEMRDLLSRVALGTRGRWKVYIVDEVHQLTPDAASALLKTLEEPPSHVVFVLATTDPQKVLPTIRSRTQHYEFRLLGADVLGQLLSDVNAQAELGLPAETIDQVVRRGHGSARDALSVLDQVAAAGDVTDEGGAVGDIVEALVQRDPGRVLTGMALATGAGRDPRRLAVDLLEHLRNGFLATQAPTLVLLAPQARDEVEEQARRMGLAAMVKALEVIGQANVDMREAIDPRVTLEAALVRLAAPAVDGSPAALLERIERLERQVAQLAGSAGATAGVAAGPDRISSESAGAPAGEPRGQDRPRPAAGGPRSLGAPPPMPGRRAPTAAGASRPAEPAAGPGLGMHLRERPGSQVGGQVRPAPGAAPAARSAGPVQSPRSDQLPARSGPPRRPPGSPAPGASSAVGAAPPSRDELTKAWGDHILPRLRPALKAYISAGRFLAGNDGATAVYAVADPGLLARALPMQPEIEAALASYFGRPVAISLVVDGDSVPVRAAELAADEAEDESVWDVEQLRDAGPGLISPEQRLLEAFPGAEEVTP